MTEDIKRTQVPTHLRIDDQLTIGWFTFTFRQLALLMVGGGATYESWAVFPTTTLALTVGDTAATWLKVVSVGLLVLLTLALAFVRRRGRTLESWLFIRLRYASQPTFYRWRRQPEGTLRLAPAQPTSAGDEKE